MTENEKQESRGKKAIFRVTKYSRRQSLKRAVITGATPNELNALLTPQSYRTLVASE
jgi:hypothetical protein